MSISHFKACCGGKLGIRKQIELYIKGKQSLDLFFFFFPLPRSVPQCEDPSDVVSSGWGWGWEVCETIGPLDHALHHAVFRQNVKGVSSEKYLPSVKNCIQRDPGGGGGEGTSVGNMLPSSFPRTQVPAYI